MIFRQLFDAESNALTYLLADTAGGEAVVIDPLKSQATLILALLAERELRLIYVLRTHVHLPDHSDCGDLCPRTGARFVLGRGCSSEIPGERVGEGVILNFGTEQIHVIATPGHTPGSICYLCQDRLFTGDTLNIGGNSHRDAEADLGQLFDSVKQKLFSLPDETLVFPGHDFRGRTVSTMGEERRRNPAFLGQTRESFSSFAKKAPASVASVGNSTGRLSHGLGLW